MSGHLRCGFAVFFLAAGLATPAAANVLTDLFTPNAASEAATAAPAAASTPAPEQCLRQPGAPAAGQHWFYRLDGSRKCWYQAAEDSTPAKRAARHRVASRHAAAADEDEPAPRKQKAVEDARAELVNSAPAQRSEPAPVASAPAQTQESAPVPAPAPQPAPAPAQAAMPPPTPSAPKLTMVHTVPVQVADAAAQVPPVLVPTTLGVAQPASGQPAADQARPPQVDVEKLLAEAPAASDEVASAASATPIAADWIASWLGGLLMALGCAALLSASGTLRQVLGAVRLPGSGTELPAIEEESRYEPAFGRIAAALEHDERTRRAAAAALPAEEALWEEGIGALAALTGPASPEAFSGRPAMAYRGAEQQGHWSDS
jgi:hypothetical protein